MARSRQKKKKTRSKRTRKKSNPFRVGSLQHIYTPFGFITEEQNEETIGKIASNSEPILIGDAPAPLYDMRQYYYLKDMAWAIEDDDRFDQLRKQIGEPELRIFHYGVEIGGMQFPNGSYLVGYPGIDRETKATFMIFKPDFVGATPVQYVYD